MSEHDFEPVRGLPGDLPEGEVVLWQGSPDWRLLAQEAFHVRAVAVYFAVMLGWRIADAIFGGEAPLAALQAALSVTPIALAALGLLALLAWLNSRTTVYTITNRRVVMRFGAALPKAINIPLPIIENVALKSLPRGAGDLALALKPPNKIAFLHLWPHARPWRVSAPQPTLRALSDVRGAAEIIAAAMQDRLRVAAEHPGEASRPFVPAPGYSPGEPVAA